MPHDRKLFIASPSIGVNPSDFEFFEEQRLHREADHSARPLHTQTGNKAATRFGLPQYKETPRLKVALKNKPLDFYGFERWILSSRAKDLLHAMDPAAFDFRKCETSAPPRHNIDNYWIGKVRRVIEEFDRGASNFEKAGRQWDVGLEEWTFNHAIRKLNTLVLHPGHEESLAFYILDYSLYPIFDGRLVEAIRGAGLRGLMFSPLQWPDKGDVRTVYIENYGYWKDQGAL
ncbi:MAG: DUF1629 domain-containing protein [Pseudomonadota bacterium]